MSGLLSLLPSQLRAVAVSAVSASAGNTAASSDALALANDMAARPWYSAQHSDSTGTAVHSVREIELDHSHHYALLCLSQGLRDSGVGAVRLALARFSAITQSSRLGIQATMCRGSSVGRSGLLGIQTMGS